MVKWADEDLREQLTTEEGKRRCRILPGRTEGAPLQQADSWPLRTTAKVEH